MTNQLFQTEKGQTLIEYGLVIAVIVLVTILTIPSLRESILNVFDHYHDTLEETSEMWHSNEYVYSENFDNINIEAQ